MSSKSSRTRRTIDPNAPVRAIVYVRLSKAKSGDGNTDASLDTQRASCERAVVALGGEVVGVEQDVIAGGRIDRPGLWQAIDRIKAGEANTLVVHALDRLGRDQDQQGAIMLELRRAGGKLLSATENIEDSPLGKFMRAAITFVAEAEKQAIRERVNRGLSRTFPQTGRYKPGRRVIYGYRRVGKGLDATYAVDPNEAVVVERIFRLRASGASLRNIVDALNADGVPSPTGKKQWATAAVRDVLARSVYWTGQHEVWRTRTEYDVDDVPYMEDRPAEERYVVPFDPLIDPALADRAQAAAKRNVWKSRRQDRPGEHGLLRYGYGRCAGCGRALSVVNRPDRQPRYSCTNQHGPCRQPAAITLGEVDDPIWRWVTGILEDADSAAAYRVAPVSAAPDPAQQAALADAERQVADLEAQAAGMIDTMNLLTGAAKAIAAAKVEALNGDLEAAQRERDRLASSLTIAATSRPATVDLDAIAAATGEAIRAMQDADPGATDVLTLRPRGTMTMTRRQMLGVVGAGEVTVPGTWTAKQAALSVLNVAVEVTKAVDGRPRWAATMRFGDGSGARAMNDPGAMPGTSVVHQQRRSDLGDAGYLFGTPRSITP